jgi:hypothetical protein
LACDCVSDRVNLLVTDNFLLKLLRSDQARQ